MYALIFAVAHKRGELGETRTGQNQRSILRQDLKIAMQDVVNRRWSVFVLLVSFRYFRFFKHSQSECF